MSQESATAVAEQVETAQPETTRRDKPKQQPRYHVILWDDDDHSHTYVIAMMLSLFGYPSEKGYQIAEGVHTRGRAIVITTTLEHAELKRDQIHAFGADASIRGCKGAMWSTIESLQAE